MNATYTVPSGPTDGYTNVFPGVVADGVVSCTAFENVWPRSRETATMIFPFPFAPLTVVHIA